MSIDDVANKIEWEGGIISALEYGIHADDIEDEELANLWEQLEQAYNPVHKLIILIEDFLGEHSEVL